MITDREFVEAWANALQRLRSYARWLSRDRLQIDDLLQQTALQAWEARHHLRSDSNVVGWLFVILRNCHYDRHRRPKFEVEDPDGKRSEAVGREPEHEVERELNDVDRALNGLPGKQRQALSYVALRGLSYAETARLSGCKEGTIKSRVARARQGLIEALDHAREVRRCSGSGKSSPFISAGRTRQRAHAPSGRHTYRCHPSVA